MTNRLLGAALIAAIVLVGGLLVYQQLFQDEPATVAQADAGGTAPALDATAPIPSGPEVAVIEVEGSAEARQQDGTWRTIKTGDKLALGDRIRTGEASAVTIDVAGNIVSVGARSNLVVPQLAEVSLKEGQLNAAVAETETAFVVRNEGSDARASAKSGEFAVLNDGRGRVTVASKSGTTTFSAAGRTIDVEEGNQSTSAGAAPSAPQVIPTSLFLKIQNPRKKLRRKLFALRGRSSPGALIRVNGKVVEVGADGSFTHQVELNEGRNQLAVEGYDVVGRKAKETVSLQVDSTGPRIGTEVEW